MIKINENFLDLQDNYLFDDVNQKWNEYVEKNHGKKIINLGIGDVTLPLPRVVVDAMKNACEEMSKIDTFKGYGPSEGYKFLRDKIVEYDYGKRGINISADEVFISDGAKNDIGNLSEIFDVDNKIAIQNPVYPVYLDTNVIAGRSGKYLAEKGKYENIIYLTCNEENKFNPQIPDTIPNIIYLCSPNNPTGATMNKEELEKWVNYAKKYNSIILFDSAYEKYITDTSIPHSIYEIEGAKKVAIEIRSFSKTAGFTGIRCSYTVIPKELKIYVNKYNKEISILDLWKRRCSCKFNGVSYITQRGAQAVYTSEGQEEIMENIQYYLQNCKIIKESLEKIGYNVYGGKNSPYIWLKIPKNMKSWEFFDNLLEKVNIVGTPGVGFGSCGEGYFRITGYAKRNETIEAMERIKILNKVT